MKIIVTGAGIAGLGAATYLSEKGHDVTVLEASDHVGGRAITLKRPGTNDYVDTGTQYFHSNYTRALKLVRQVGLGTTLSKVKGYTRIYSDRTPSGSFLLNHRTPWYTSAGVLGNLQLGYYLMSNLFKYPMDPFGDRHRPIADKLDGLLQSSNPLIREAVVRPLSLTGALSEPESMDISVLHVLRLIRVILLTDYLSLDGGTASLHERLAARLNVRLNTRVSGLIVDGKKVIGVEVEGGHEVLAADKIVVATTPPAALKILPLDWREERVFLESIRIPSFSLPTFFLDRPLQNKVWSYLMREEPGRKISFITDAAQKNPSMVPSGKAAVQPWICFPQSREISRLSDEAILQLCQEELDELFPGFGNWIEHVHITHHQYAVPFSSQGHHERSMRFLRNTEERGVSFCGDYLSGGYMESALWSAEMATNNVDRMAPQS